LDSDEDFGEGIRMTYLRKNEAIQAAYGVLMDITLYPGDPQHPDEIDDRLRLVHKLIKGEMAILAMMASDLFDQTGLFPQINNESLKRCFGEDAALDCGDALDAVGHLRRDRALRPLPVQFVDENGNPDNVVYIADWLAQRKMAA
jgi:hypothetical protein